MTFLKINHEESIFVSGWIKLAFMARFTVEDIERLSDANGQPRASII
jgi:hypothetical protein